MKRKNTPAKVWCRFGHVCLYTSHSEDETAEKFNLQELYKFLNERAVFRFVKGINETEIKNNMLDNLEKFMSEKYPPYYRYEFLYTTLSNRILRVKVYMQQDRSDPRRVVYRNTQTCEVTNNILRSSLSYPYFYLCSGPARTASVSILEPSGQMDIHFIVEENFTSVPDEFLKESEILFDYVRLNLKIKPDGNVKLSSKKLKKGFACREVCKARRNTYSVDTAGSKFTVKLNRESVTNQRGDTKEKVHIHLNSDEWDTMLQDATWQPQQIVATLPEFINCARNLARKLDIDYTVPLEILLRGPKAQDAYELALKSGKTKNVRVLIMIVGQARAGKTSLLRSLKGETFNLKEDSTEGVTVHFSKIDGSTWNEQDFEEQLLDNCTARVLVDKLQNKPTVDDLFPPQTERENNDLTQDVNDEHELPSQYTPGIEGETSKSGDLGEREPGKVDKQTEHNRSKAADSEPTLVAENLPEDVIKAAANMMRENPAGVTEDDFYFTILDFAGQPVYSNTHPLFLSPKGIYILVHSLKNDENAQATPFVKHGALVRKVDDHCPMTNMDHLESWLSFVALSSNRNETLQHQPKDSSRKFPPVFLTCTHADIPFNNQNAEEISRRLLYHLTKKEHTLGEHLVRAIYPVNNTVSGDKENQYVKTLREDICRAARTLPHMKEDIPIRWLKFEKKLSNLVKDEHKKHILLEEAEDIASKCKVQLASDEFSTLLNYLHDLKVIVYFEDANMVIIDVQWLLDMIVKVITVQPIEDWDERYEESWRRLEEDGILDRGLVDHVWSDMVDDLNTIDSLLLIMERFSLVCQWKAIDGSKSFLVPSMLMNSEEKKADLLLKKQTSSPLVVRFTHAHLPLGIFPRLLISIVEMCNSKWPNSRQPKFFHNFCRFFDVGDERGLFDLVVMADIRTIAVGVISEQSTECSDASAMDLCQYIFGFLKTTLNDMRHKFPWMKTMSFDFGIRCPICSQSTVPCRLHQDNACTRDACVHLITEEELSSQRPRCCRNPTSENTVIKNESYSHWFLGKCATNPNLFNKVQLLDLADISSALVHPVIIYQELLAILGESLMTIDARQAARKIAAYLDVDKSSMDDPKPDVVSECQALCQRLKDNKRHDIIRHLRLLLPSGITGPLLDWNTLVQNMDIRIKQSLTRSLCAQDVWKRLANELGVPSSQFSFYDRMKDPVEGLLAEVCYTRCLSVGDLYCAVVTCGANALADEYL